MKQQDWATLIWSLQRDNCILFLGPEGAPMTGNGLWPSSLVDQLGVELRSQMNGVPATDTFGDVARRYEIEYSRGDLARVIEHFYTNQSNEPAAAIQSLASLPFYTVITSCHDRLLERAFEKQGKLARTDLYDFRGGTSATPSIGTTANPLIYHLYGLPSHPESLVLTDLDLLDFLVAVVSKDPPLPPSLKAELQKQGKSMLFVGFGVRHWHLRILLHVLRASRADSRSFAFEPFEEPTSQSDRRTVLFYKEGYKLEVFNEPLEAFIYELAKRYVASPNSSQTTQPTNMGFTQQPKVFLCYAREDRQTVEGFYRALTAAGFDAWMDREKLESGDRWNQVIEERLLDADYCLVFMSTALANKNFSYVNREISMALERQRYARRGTRFIIPVRVDDTPLLPELSDLQAERVRVDEAGRISTLLTRDYQRRGRA